MSRSLSVIRETTRSEMVGRTRGHGFTILFEIRHARKTSYEGYGSTTPGIDLGRRDFVHLLFLRRDDEIRSFWREHQGRRLFSGMKMYPWITRRIVHLRNWTEL